MRQFVLVTGDFVKTGGMDRANHALAMVLANRGYEIHLVTHRVSSDLANFAGVVVHRVPKLANSYTLAGPLLDLAGRYWGRRVARSHGRVVVNGGNCVFGDVNWVHYLHGCYAPVVSGPWRRRFRRRLSCWLDRRGEGRALAKAKVIIANSDSTRRSLIERYGLSSSKVRVVYYGIDSEVFYPATPEEKAAIRAKLGWLRGKTLVAFVGALGDRRKGFDTAFRAWQVLCNDPRWEAELMVVGTGVELPFWQAQVEAAGLNGRVHFLGFRSDVHEIMRACDALVSPTHYEAYGLNVHEALCCALPAFVSESAGVAERYPLELRHLLLSNPADAQELVRGLRTWRESPESDGPALLSLAAELRSHTWEDMGRQILSFIECAE